MRAVPFVLLVPLILLAGCMDAGVDIIEQARQDDREPQESVEGEVETPTDTTPRIATPVEAPTPSTPTGSTPPTVTAPPPTTTPATTPPVTTTPPSPPPATPTPATPPPPTPTPAAPAPTASPWPTESSYVRYEVETRGPEGTTRAFAEWQYDDDDWTGSCEGTRTDAAGGTERVRRAYDADDPPHWPLFNTREPPAEGGSVTAWYLLGCEITSRSATYDGDHTASGPGFTTRWDARTGLVLEWSWTDDDRSSTGRLVASG